MEGETVTTTIALLGAGGKMGRRITANLQDHPSYAMRYVEVDSSARSELAEVGVRTTPQDEALTGADVVVLAIPDHLIGPVSGEIVPRLAPGALLIVLDPAAPHAGVIPLRDDIGYFVTHPCHPPVFHDEATPEAREDWFGGSVAKQAVVCALLHGSEDAYALGESIARDMYAPVGDAYRLSVEQMAILEITLAEAVSAPLVTALHEALGETVAMGVPEEAARAFFFGHLRIQLAIIFGFAGFPFSDAAEQAIQKNYRRIFRPDWKDRLMEPEALERSVREVVEGT